MRICYDAYVHTFHIFAYITTPIFVHFHTFLYITTTMFIYFYIFSYMLNPKLKELGLNPQNSQRRGPKLRAKPKSLPPDPEGLAPHP